MTDDTEFTFTTRSSGETEAYGRRLGALLEAGCVVGLTGELGAGKTCFVKGIAGGLNNTPADEVTSPTFTILQEYPGAVPLYHFDAYRLSGCGDLESVGFDEYAGSDGAAVIEWADRISAALPQDALLITIEVAGESERRFVCRGRGELHGRIGALFKAACDTAGA